MNKTVVESFDVIREFERKHPDKNARIGALCAEVAILRNRIADAASTLRALTATVLK
jgi:hypothetical protein